MSLGAEHDSPEKIRERVRNSALGSLTRREHSRTELRRKLTKRCEEPEIVEETLNWLTDLGYLDDQRFTEMFIRNSIGNGRGPVRIAHELRQKGIDGASIEQALEASETDWTELASEVLKRKFPSPPQDLKEKAKQVRYLQYRGFQPDQVFSQFD